MIWNIISCGIRSLSLQNYYLFVLSLYNILFESGNQIILDLNFTSSVPRAIISVTSYTFLSLNVKAVFPRPINKNILVIFGLIGNLLYL